MKNCGYICGVHGKNIILFAVAGIFISASGKHRNHGLPILSDFRTAKYGNVLAGTGDSAALFLCSYYNFSFAMARTMEDCNYAQCASNATSAHDTGKITLTSNSTPEERVRYWQDHAETWRNLYVNSLASLTEQGELMARISELQCELSEIRTRSALAKLNEIPLREKSFTIKKSH